MTASRYRWVIVAAGGLLGCVAIGGMFSLPVFLQPIAKDTGWSVVTEVLDAEPGMALVDSPAGIAAKIRTR